jgi:hypothetical protein
LAEDACKLRKEKESWEKTASQHLENELYYRGLLEKIGRKFGAKAFTDDAGEMHTDVLIAKVPELVDNVGRLLDEMVRSWGGIVRTRWIEEAREAGFSQELVFHFEGKMIKDMDMEELGRCWEWSRRSRFTDLSPQEREDVTNAVRFRIKELVQ